MGQRLTLDDLSPAQAVALVDGLIAAGQLAAAEALARAMLPNLPADGAEALRLRVRLGLAATPSPRTLLIRDALAGLERGVKDVFAGEGLITWSKASPFYEDHRFAQLADRHAHLSPLPNWHWNLQTVLWAVERARHVEGDLVELGVFKGHTTLFCAEYVDFANWPKRWWLYDTFDGIPQDQLDKGWENTNRIYKETFSFEEVRDRFAPFANVRVTKGRVPEVLTSEAPDSIAFLHVDLNNATAEIAALEILYDRISPGGLIVFDDFGWSVSRAQREAEIAWFAAKGLKILPLPTGQGLFVKP